MKTTSKTITAKTCTFQDGYISPYGAGVNLKFMKIADEEKWDTVVHDCSNYTKFARGLNQSSKEGKWFGASNYGCEFSEYPLMYFYLYCVTKASDFYIRRAAGSYRRELILNPGF